MPSIIPPSGDEVIERHQFYATIASQTTRNSTDINAIGAKISDSSKAFHTLKDGVKASDTQLKTFLTMVVVAWTVIGGGVGLYVQRGLASYDQLTSNIESLNRKSLMLENHIEQLKETPTQVDAMKRSLNDHQRQLDELNSRMGK